jgi:hypothetical protein
VPPPLAASAIATVIATTEIATLRAELSGPLYG